MGCPGIESAELLLSEKPSVAEDKIEDVPTIGALLATLFNRGVPSR